MSMGFTIGRKAPSPQPEKKMRGKVEYVTVATETPAVQDGGGEVIDEASENNADSGKVKKQVRKRRGRKGV